MTKVNEEILIEVPVYRFSEETHYEYMEESSLIMRKYDPNYLGIQIFFGPFEQAIQNEDDALEHIRKSPETVRIAKVDVKFDSSFGGLRDYTHSFLKHFGEQERYAAENLSVVLKKYGNIAKEPYRQELAMAHNLIQDLRKHPADIQTLNLAPWINALETVTNEMLALLDKRNIEVSQQTHLKVKETRQETDILYQKIVNRINAMINIHGKAFAQAFFDEFNTHATEYKNKYAQHIGRIRSGKEEKFDDKD
jgi:hypothetical protein